MTWAPVNCGFKEDILPFGKMYQWGRKNGIGYHDAAFKDGISTSISDMWNGKNGDEDTNTFYKYGEKSKYNYDWISEGDDTYWNVATEENPVKNNAFDPCPDGWRIPTAFEFKSLIDYVGRAWMMRDNLKGFLFYSDSDHQSEQDEFFLPACGRLNTLDGAAYDRNTEGYYWTNTANNGNSSYLYFYEKDCSVNKQGSRAGGCSIRCIKE